MMEQRSQMLRQMRLTKTERDREVNGCPGSGLTWPDHTFEELSSGGGIRMTHLTWHDGLYP